VSPLAVLPRERANQDAEDAIAYYVSESAVDAALGFIDALEQAYMTLGEHPGIGSPRWGDELDLPGLRSWPLAGYPFLVFYVEQPDHVDVWRVLHMRRDLQTTLGAADAG